MSMKGYKCYVFLKVRLMPSPIAFMLYPQYQNL